MQHRICKFEEKIIVETVYLWDFITNSNYKSLYIVFTSFYFVSQCYLHILEPVPCLVTAFLNEIIVSSEC
jgi:hypothetical protein